MTTADEFSTPLASLPQMISTRDGKPQPGDMSLSYDEILTNSAPTQPMVARENLPPHPSQMNMPPHQTQAHVGEGQYMPDMNEPPVGHIGQYMNQHAAYQPPPPVPQPTDENSSEDSDKSVKNMIRSFISSQKRGIVIMLIIITLIMFVYPRLKQMPRFAQQNGLPLWTVLFLAAGGSTMTSVVEYVL